MGWDGVADSSRTSTYAYDENGEVLSRLSESDWDGDGISDSTTSSNYSYTYDADGNVVERVIEQDVDGDGVFDVTYTQSYEYDEDGNVISADVHRPEISQTFELISLLMLMEMLFTRHMTPMKMELMMSSVPMLMIPMAI